MPGRLVVAGCWLTGFLLASGGVAAQTEVAGVVRAAPDGAPVPYAALTLDASTLVRADADGRFRFADVAAGPHSLTVRGIGWRPLRMFVAVPPGRALVRVAPRLTPLPVRLEPIVVVARSSRERLSREGFFERRDLGFGHFVTREEIVERDPRQVSYFLTRLARRFRQSCTLWIDGIPAETLGNIVEAVDLLLRPDMVAGLEIYGGAATTPIRFAGRGGRCTVVAWTR